jgi:hypothetical protein
MTDSRATRYLRLALAESDPDKARLLRLLADEADQGISCSPKHKMPSALPTPISPAT